MSDQSQQDQAQQARQAQAQAGEMRQDQAQQAQQSGERSRTGNGNGGNGRWQHYGKHVRRIANAGFTTSQAAEIVEVQREVATETTDSMTEKFVTREHFDAAVAGLRQHTDSAVAGLRQHTDSQVERLDSKIDSAVERLCERIEALEKSFDKGIKILMWGAGIGITLLGALLVALVGGGVMVVLHLLGS